MGRTRTQEQGQYVEFAKRYRLAMEACGLSPDHNIYLEIGKELGVSGATVGNWLNGDKLPSMDKAITIASRSGFCVEWLLTGRGPVTPEMAVDPKAAPHIAEILKLLHGSDPDTCRRIVAAMRGFVGGKPE